MHFPEEIEAIVHDYALNYDIASCRPLNIERHNEPIKKFKFITIDKNGVENDKLNCIIVSKYIKKNSIDHSSLAWWPTTDPVFGNYPVHSDAIHNWWNEQLESHLDLAFLIKNDKKVSVCLWTNNNIGVYEYAILTFKTDTQAKIFMEVMTLENLVKLQNNPVSGEIWYLYIETGNRSNADEEIIRIHAPNERAALMWRFRDRATKQRSRTFNGLRTCILALSPGARMAFDDEWRKLTHQEQIVIYVKDKRDKLYYEMQLLDISGSTKQPVKFRGPQNEDGTYPCVIGTGLADIDIPIMHNICDILFLHLSNSQMREAIHKGSNNPWYEGGFNTTCDTIIDTKNGTYFENINIVSTIVVDNQGQLINRFD